jgi:hypothetical protein
MITTTNAPVLPPEKRELVGPRSGFGSSLDRHPDNHDQRFWNTSHGDSYGEHGPRSKQGKALLKASMSAPTLGAGLTSEHMEARAMSGGRAVGKLTGECYKVSSDPAKDTKTQKQWMYGADPAMTHIHLGGTKKRLQGPDNEMSLPLGEGNMAKIRESAKLRGGMFARSATHITRGAHLLPGVTVFQDG